MDSDTVRTTGWRVEACDIIELHFYICINNNWILYKRENCHDIDRKKKMIVILDIIDVTIPIKL